MMNRLTWRTAQRQRAKEVQADKKETTQELAFKYWSLTERAAALALQAQIQAAQISAHTVGSSNNKRLAKKYSKAACQMTGRAIDVWIRTPSSKESSGQFTRTRDKGYIQLDPGLGARSTVRTFLHEASHGMLHWNSIKATKLHLRSPRTIDSHSRSPRNQATYDAEEDEANKLADKMETLLNTDIDPLKPDYENRALDWLILHS